MLSLHKTICDSSYMKPCFNFRWTYQILLTKHNPKLVTTHDIVIETFLNFEVTLREYETTRALDVSIHLGQHSSSYYLHTPLFSFGRYMSLFNNSDVCEWYRCGLSGMIKEALSNTCNLQHNLVFLVLISITV